MLPLIAAGIGLAIVSLVSSDKSERGQAPQAGAKPAKAGKAASDTLPGVGDPGDDQGHARDAKSRGDRGQGADERPPTFAAWLKRVVQRVGRAVQRTMSWIQRNRVSLGKLADALGLRALWAKVRTVTDIWSTVTSMA